MQKSKLKRILCLLALSTTSILAGCSSDRPPPHVGSAWVKPIRPSCKDKVTADLKRQIVTHNTAWAKERGVKLPPVKKDACKKNSPS
jgi:hypothetical protein